MSAAFMPHMNGNTNSVTLGSGFKNPTKIDRGKYLPLQGEIQNSSSSETRVYVFGNGDVTEEEINNTDQIQIELRPRGKQQKLEIARQRQETETEPLFIEKDIIDGESIQSFALQYGCTAYSTSLLLEDMIMVSELKRVNNLINDHDIYALQRIKIPVKRYGILAEKHENEENTAASSSKDYMPLSPMSPIDGEPLFDSDGSETHFRTLSIRSSIGEDDESKQFLRNMDKDLERIAKQTRTYKDSLEEVTSVLNERRIYPLAFPRKPQKTNYTEQILSTNWKTAAMIVVVCAIVFPLLYYILYKR